MKSGSGMSKPAFQTVRGPVGGSRGAIRAAAVGLILKKAQATGVRPAAKLRRG